MTDIFEMFDTFGDRFFEKITNLANPLIEKLGDFPVSIFAPIISFIFKYWFLKLILSVTFIFLGYLCIKNHKRQETFPIAFQNATLTKIYTDYSKLILGGCLILGGIMILVSIVR